MFSAASKGGPDNRYYPDATLAAGGSGSSTANLTTYTFSSLAINTANSNRVVVAVVQTQATVSSVTIGGISATVIGVTACYLAYAVVPTGTTATVVVTHTGSTSRCYVDLFTIVPGKSTTPSDTATDGVVNSINVVKGGVAVFLSTNVTNNTAFTTTWSGSDTKTSSGGANGSGNFYWRLDYFTTPFASSYVGTLTSSLSAKKVMAAWR